MHCRRRIVEPSWTQPAGRLSTRCVLINVTRYQPCLMHTDQRRRDKSCLMHTPCSDPCHPRWIAQWIFSGWDRSLDLRLTLCTRPDTRRRRCILLFLSTIFCLPIHYRGLNSSSMLLPPPFPLWCT